MSGPGDEQGGVTLRLPFARTAPRVARARLTAFLVEAGVAQRVIDDAALVISELSSNGILHGRADEHDGIEVSWVLADRAVVISVVDGGGASVPHVTPVDLYSGSGRGLALVDTVCRSWTVERVHGTRVTAELALT